MKLIFLHIPKAGGTTFHRVLERLYQESSVFTIEVKGQKSTLDKFTSLSDEKKRAIGLLKGHMPFGLHTHFQGEESKYVTLFRDPVERIISHYEFVLRTPKHYLHDEVTSNNYTLLDYALSDLSIELDNHQCRSLVEGKSAAINEFSRELYEEALKNVEKHFISFGLVEEFDKSLILFRRDLKWEGYPYYVKFNVKPISAKKDISGEVRAKVAERNKWDQNLYQWAKREFALRMMGLPDLHNELNILRVASEAYKDGMDKGASVEREYLTRNRKGLKGRILNLLNR